LRFPIDERRRLLKVEDPVVRAEVLFVLAAIGPQAEAAVAPVTSALSDKDRDVMLTAGYCLGKIGPPAKAAVPELKRLLTSEDKIVKLTGIWALLQIGPKNDAMAQTALPLLTDALTHEYEFVRVEAALALGDLGKSAAEAIPALEEAKNDNSLAVRQAVAGAIEKIAR
jgi:HEAT repeat protein